MAQVGKRPKKLHALCEAARPERADAAGGEARRPRPARSRCAGTLRPRRRPVLAMRRATTRPTTGAASPPFRGWRRTSRSAHAPGFVPDLCMSTTGRRRLTPAYLRYCGMAAPALGHHHPQPRLPGPVRRGDLPAARTAAGGLVGRRRRVLRRRRLSEGRACRRPARSPPSARPMRRKSARRSSAWASKAWSTARAGDLHGIVNGIDTEVWNPQTDPLIARPLFQQGAVGPRRATGEASKSASASTMTARRSSASSRG